MQAALAPLFALLKKFATLAEALLLSIAVTVLIEPLVLTTVLLRSRLFPQFRSIWDVDRLQMGYIATILIVGGVVGGTVLGILRWRMQQWHPRNITNPPDDSWWKRYLSSAALWIAAVTIFTWLTATVSWAGASDLNYRYVDLLLGMAGMLVIAPIPAIWPLPAGTDRKGAMGRYFVLLLKVTAGTVTVLALLSFPILWVYGILWLALCVLRLIVPMILWVIAYGWLAAGLKKGLHAYPGTSLRHPPMAVDWLVVAGGAAGQIGVLLLALLASAPNGTGIYAAGCLSNRPASGSEYWFWKSYKGVASESITPSGLMFRPAIDSSVCMTVAAKDLTNPVQIGLGHLNATRAWFWLIDPEDWEGERTVQIRNRLQLSLGREFSSYAELQAWWEQNSEYLNWTGVDTLLEVHRPDLKDLAHSYTYYQEHPRSTPSEVELIRERSLWFPGTEPVVPPPIFDREARLRGLKLRTADSIDVLTGKREHDVFQRLQQLTGESFETKEEWRAFLEQLSPPNPWRMSRVQADADIAAIQTYGNRPGYEEKNLKTFQEKTGENYSHLVDFIPWLANPVNTRGDDWRQARALYSELCDQDEIARGAYAYSKDCPAVALRTLQFITDQKFTLPEEWVQWWQENSRELTLSDDGMKLVIKAK
jgi:hypothetical protein